MEPSPVSDLASPAQSARFAGVVAVIPAYNEEIAIGSVVLKTRQYVSQVIVVDDGSKDRTAEVATLAGAEVIRLEENTGKTYALLLGLKKAREQNCSAAVMLDADGQHHASDIPRLVSCVLDGSADLVIGSRNLGGRKAIPPYLSNTNGNADSLSKGPAEFHSTDPASTIRALGVHALALLDLLPTSDQFAPMMITLFSRHNLAIREIPIVPRYDLSTAAEDGDVLPCYRGNKIAVVVPAYNEELLIGDTLAGIPDFVTRVYVVNDCSKDRTREVIDYYASQDPSIVAIHHEKNCGVGAAIVSGYKRALEDGMDVVAVMAGDNQMDPAFLPDLIDPIIDRKCDYTMGNRLVNPVYRKGMSKWRFFGNTILTMLTKIASGYWQMMDPQNGYTAISKRALERINLDNIYPRYGYCNDILVKLNVLSFRVINVPHPSRYGREKSGIKYSTYIVKLSRLLLHDFLWRLKMKYIVLNFHPLVFFYVFGAVLSVCGVIGGIFSLFHKFVEHGQLFVPALLSLIAFGLGIQCIFFAMFFDMQQERGTNGWYG
jgi:glycosyltransferase involved in cell wall biosynthesis